MRSRLPLAAVLAAALASPLASAASANVLIQVDKSTQQMTVSVDGSTRYQFAVSTGRPGYGTPSGTFHPQHLERTWFSHLYYNSPMPHSIFFHGGFAIHGSYEINRLGGPASHGCIRLHPDNAATLYALVEQQGMAATTIVVSGESPSVRRAPAENDYQSEPASLRQRRAAPQPPPNQQWQYQQPNWFYQQPQRGNNGY
jgi:lipoprotein-anchoring transpeptidase ErfK/SrfK